MNKQLLEGIVYTKPALFAECIDSIFSNNLPNIVQMNGNRTYTIRHSVTASA